MTEDMGMSEESRARAALVIVIVKGNGTFGTIAALSESAPDFTPHARRNARRNYNYRVALKAAKPL